MPTDPRTPFDTWHSRAPAAPLPPTGDPITVHHVDTDPDALPYSVVLLGGVEASPRFVVAASAELAADTLRAALAPLLAPAVRARSLQTDTLLAERVIGARPIGPRTVLARAVRYVLTGEGAAEPAAWEGVEVAPTLDRVTTGGAVVADGSGE